MVLIIEDDGTTRKALSRILTHLGITARSAGSLGEAREKLANEPTPRCLIVDLALPDGSGADLITEVRSAGIPAGVAIVTGSVLADQARTIKSKVGADAVFTKPVDLVDLMQWVQQCCRSD